MPAKLMIPGPIELEPEVLQTLAQPAVPHYGDAWVSVHNETVGLLQQVFQTQNYVFMFPGSGSLGLDAAAHSAFLPGETVIAGNNGWFGERITDILKSNGVNVVPVEADPRQALDPQAFREALRANPQATGVAVVHLETSTSVLNPIKEIADVVRQNSDALLMVDAVTGLAGAELQTDAWGIDLCVSASQKALGGPAGLGLVAVSPRAQARIDNRPEAGRSWYLDLKRWNWFVENWADWHPFPVTMPTAVVLALRTSLKSLLAEGVETRRARWQAMADHLRAGLRDLEMPLFVPEAMMTSILTAAYCPEGINSVAIRDYLLEECNIQITTGFGKFKEQVIRVGHMGGALTDADITQLLAGIEAFLNERQPN
ncbi:MAG: alanine--glyoxylate aminotransferase family protein [Chloroflexi bacterium]|nr:alanine--glyoxylate aminotransferase family protein [Chloroflexota bacterium]MCC6894832.1 alanine--glyoxylate aminotransferase family protein [Anaerolineae bacterium]